MRLCFFSFTLFLRQSTVNFKENEKIDKHSLLKPLREKFPNTEFFWFLFSRIRTEYREILVSLRIQSESRKIRTRKKIIDRK